MEWTPKAPGDARLYSYDLSDIYPDTIVTAVFTLASGTVTLTAVDPDSRTAFVVVAGGANGETAVLSLTVVTNLGQTIVRSISLPIVTAADSLSPDSSITKGDIIIRALGKLGIANYVFDTEAEEDSSALRQLDSLAASWGDDFGYIQPATNGTSLPTDSAGIDEQDVDAFIYSLAEILAPDYGKTPAPALLKRAADTRATFLIRHAAYPEFKLSRLTPRGAGNRYYGRRFFAG